MSKKEFKKLILKIKKNAPLLLMVIGAFLMSISTIHWYFKYQSLTISQEILAQHNQIQEQKDNSKVPVHIYIQWFLDTPISVQIIENQKWTISDTQASYLSQSAKPGEQGNIIIYGHNTREIMGNIRALKGSEIIQISTQNGDIHLYKIKTIDEVDPSNTEYLLPTNEETLTLYTCSGFMDKKRFIIQATPILE